MCVTQREVRSRPTVARVGTLGAGRLRRGFGAVAARPPSNSGHSFSLKFYVRSSIGECNCKALDALAGEFGGCVKESDAQRIIIGECNCKALDALAGEFRGCVEESDAQCIIREYKCKALDALAGEFRGCVKETMRSVLLGNATAKR